MSKADKLGHKTWLVLQIMQEEALLAPKDGDYRTPLQIVHDAANKGFQQAEDGYVWHEVQKPERKEYPTVSEHLEILSSLFQAGVIDATHTHFSDATLLFGLSDKYVNGKSIKGLYFRIRQPKFEEIYSEYSKQYGAGQYEISIRDREIWVNDFLLSKPHAAGSRMSFFQYAYDNPNRLILRRNISDLISMDFTGKEFTRLLNALGFKGELLKAFFPKRAKSAFLFRNPVSMSQLLESGVDISKMEKELRKAHKIKEPNSPE